jgi:hypothetical protein
VILHSGLEPSVQSRLKQPADETLIIIAVRLTHFAAKGVQAAVERIND